MGASWPCSPLHLRGSPKVIGLITKQLWKLDLTEAEPQEILAEFVATAVRGAADANEANA